YPSKFPGRFQRVVKLPGPPGPRGPDWACRIARRLLNSHSRNQAAPTRSLMPPPPPNQPRKSTSPDGQDSPPRPAPLLVERGAVPLPLPLRISRGRSLPLGATAQPNGINFALLCRHGTAVWLVLYPLEGEGPVAEVELHPLRNRTGDHWHVLVAG